MYLLSLMDDMDFKPYNQNNATAKEVITEDFFFVHLWKTLCNFLVFHGQTE